MNNKTNPNEGAFAAKNQYSTQVGLTKREYFASIAMQGLSHHVKLNIDPIKGVEFENAEVISDMSVAIADAIIKALNK